ncbi:N-acetylglucosamine-6-phosphate deacetylase [Neobacillus sp. OS1-32]|uniref:N-acetylglucosamine-6-phosphate deacetylase n=1 Tax=Neobacillus sp. OS1-32 TaxID=3070682 RepID=UPI0027E075E6|nr:N-acetylglucosamine-6-phosphate deacetylase [Neobacillus sp. OS1-32]WML30365.1 N-acetylglucosamine-6-phosphate deacetylase [Neobacillus sp. OS1-32]
MRYFVYADKFFLKNAVEDAGYLEIVAGKFGSYSKTLPVDHAEVIDCKGKWIAPGLVDTHIHGLLNHDVMDNDFEGIKAISEGLLSCGVTSFLPTTLTAPVDLLNKVIETIGKHYQEVQGAKIQGIYLEGPFFTEEHKGAQNPDYFSDPDLRAFEKWQQLSGGIIKKIALAPERKGAAEFVKNVTEQGVVVALGHSNASFEQAKEVVESGASVFVHTYNGMSPLTSRELGMVGAAMTLEKVFAELICDGHHVHPLAAKILMDVRGRDRVAMITDCMRAGAMPDGAYTLGEFPVIVKDGKATIENGSLAGSVLKLKEALKNVVDWGIATPEEAVMMTTIVPAASCHIDDVCGSIAPGREADFIVLTDKMELEATYLNGVCRYHV